MRVTVLCLAIFAIYLPVAWWVHRDYVPVTRPPGKIVETVKRIEHDKPDQYVVRSYVFQPRFFPSTDGIFVYEDLTPLPRENVRFTVDADTYVVRFKTRDGSDPRANGRKYWLVAAE
jgi:hypothetical protein